MKIAVVGRGNVGGGLADLWERVGYEVSRIGRESGDVSEASPRADAPIRPTRRCSGKHHEAEMEQPAGMREWLGKLYTRS
jgi:predicted dinucleotide-binding enzyme